LSHKRVQSFRKLREKETIHMIKMIGKSCGSVVDLTEMLFLLANNIICEVALGKAYNDLKFKDMLVRSQILLGVVSVGSYIPWLSWVDWLRGLEGRANKVATEFDEFLDGVIEEHINKNIATDANVDGGKDEGQ
ncbi:cytochrome P450, partial [Nitriliruptoraceae bacterium ZYF776]|nr:cytochrome P450 [Profundirhabdus halotolerans]